MMTFNKYSRQEIKKEVEACIHRCGMEKECVAEVAKAVGATASVVRDIHNETYSTTYKDIIVGQVKLNRAKDGGVV